MLILLNVLGFLMMILSGWLFFRIIVWLRPSEADTWLQFQTHSILDVVVFLLGIILLTAFYVIIHEAIHGLFFWGFTGARPQFAVHLTHAYAAAPDWLMPRGLYLITTLAPLIVISLVGLALVPFVPSNWLASIWFAITMNASGAVGDLWVAGWLVRLGADCLARDRGNSITFFLPGPPASDNR
jgi:hypothetical protein